MDWIVTLLKLPTHKKVFVFGDIILDEYINCKREYSINENIPVLREIERKWYPGNAANVAANLSLLGCETILHGVTGDDGSAHLLINQLSPKIDATRVIKRNDRQTVRKTRYVISGVTLSRVDVGTEDTIEDSVFEKLLTDFIDLSSEISMAVFCDLGKRTYSPEMIKKFSKVALEYKIPLVVDPSSRNPDIYKDISVLTPNRLEFEGLLKNSDLLNEDELIPIVKKFIIEQGIETLLLTDGEKGGYLFNIDDHSYLPALSTKFVSSIGAGDAFLAGYVASKIRGVTNQEAFVMASLCAAVAVSQPFTSFHRVEDLVRLKNINLEVLFNEIKRLKKI